MGPHSIKTKALLGLILIFLVRLGFGLFGPPVLTYEDAQQTYLIGLKSYTTHTWPYFGPDTEDPAEGNFKTQCPGALEGLLIGGALRLWPDPMAPYLLVNLLSLTALCLLAWYTCKRLPDIPSWFIFGWILICPWDLHISTQVFNLSFVCVGSVLFLMGFMESLPSTRKGLFPLAGANALMSFSIFWIMQFHLSWVLFAVLAGVSFAFQLGKSSLKQLSFFLWGALPSLAFVLPTYLHYGFQKAGDISGLLVFFNWRNFLGLFTILARFLSFASFEMPRFLGEHTPDRMAFLARAPWLVPFTVFLLVAGWVQPITFALFGFFKKDAKADWKAIKWMTLGVIILVWVSFWFTVRNPDAHRYYSVFPFAMIYSLYCWNFLVLKPFWRKFGTVFLLASLFFQVGYTVEMGMEGRSSYLRERGKIEKAIQAQDYRQLGERRPYSSY